MAWDCPLPIFSTFLVAVDAIPLGTAEAQVRLRNQPTSPKPNTPTFSAALKNCVSSLSEKKKKEKKRNRCLKSSWGREEVGLPQHPPPAALNSPSRGLSSLLPTQDLSQDKADHLPPPTWQMGRNLGLLGRRGDGEVYKEPFYGPGDRGLGSWGGRLERGEPGAAPLPVAIKTLASAEVQQHLRESRDSRTKAGRAFSQLVAFAPPASPPPPLGPSLGAVTPAPVALRNLGRSRWSLAPNPPTTRGTREATPPEAALQPLWLSSFCLEPVRANGGRERGRGRKSVGCAK